MLQHWNVKAKSKNAIPSLDYITMNRNMAKKGITDARDIRQYRDTHPRRLKIGDNSSHKIPGISPKDKDLMAKYMPAPGKRLRGSGPLPSDTNPTFTYGKPTE